MLSMDQLSLAGKRVLIREDLNVPLRDGRVANDARLRAAVPTIEAAVAAGAGVILMSHLGRPVEGEASDEFSLSPVAGALSALLGLPVTLKSEWPIDTPQAGDVWLLENVRFNVGEKANSDELANVTQVYAMYLSWTPSARLTARKHRRTVLPNLPLKPALARCWLVSLMLSVAR